MLPEPLHPAVVHFPLVLAFLLPVVAAAALWTIRRGSAPRRAWSIPIIVAAALALSAWVSLQTGEAQEDRVERVVAEQPLHEHEEEGETFFTASAVVLLLVAAGLLPGVAGKSARFLGLIGAIVLVVGAARVGHSGGQLVYRHGAASAYAVPGAESADGAVERADPDHDRDSDPQPPQR